MILKEVRHEGKRKRLLFKVLIEEDSLVISTKCREIKEPVLVDIGSLLAPYIDAKTKKQMQAACKKIYLKRVLEE